MGEDFLSLKWNNHKPAFSHLLKILREKGCYSDVTLACGSKFFAVHRLVLMACSDFFIEVFDHTTCQKPVIVLRDIKGQELEALLDYMYLGEVEVQQTDLPGLIKAAECLKIKGLAVPDEDPTQTPSKVESQKVGERPAKRRRQEREVRETDQRNVTVHSGIERIEVRGTHINQTGTVTQYTPHRSDIEIINATEQTLTPGTITVSHAGGETHLISQDPTVVQRTDLIQIQPEHISSSRIQTHETPLEPNSHLHHESHTLQQQTEAKQLETFTQSSGSDIKVEHCELEDHIDNSTLKNEVAEIHTEPLNESGATSVGEFTTHFMTVEENLAHHMFQQAQQPGPSGIHRTSGRDGGSEIVTEEANANRSGVGGAMYSTHLLAEAAPETTATTTATTTNQSGLVMTEGPVVRDEQGRLCYRCLYCPRVDSDKSKWRRHLRTHTGEKPFMCTKCPYRATTRHAVVRHDKFRHSLETCSTSLGLTLSVKADEKH